MPRVSFHNATMPQPKTVDYLPDGRGTVLDLARELNLPLYWRCGHGTCGACAARVTVLDGPVRAMDAKERNVLLREGMSPAEKGAGWRLTCGYLLSGEDLRVEW